MPRLLHHISVRYLPFPKEGPYEAPPFVIWGMVLDPVVKKC